MGLLRKGPKWTPEGHMAHIEKMADTGKLIVAGVFIFMLKSVDEARAMVDADPAVKAGRLVVELHPWFAVAGLRVNDPK